MRKMRVLPDIELLEDRRMLTATMVRTVLHIDGTAGNDVITLTETKGTAATATTAATAATYNIKINADSSTFPARLVSKIIIHGKAGNDKITVGSLVPHNWVLSIFGDDGNDTIVSSDGRDGILGGAGDDIIRGTGGHDTILGGAGNDVITADGGHNLIKGEAGNDTLFGGGGGNDVLDGGAGDDVIAGDGQYLAFAGLPAPTSVPGNDVLNGGDGNDWLLSGTGNAKIKSNTGRDTLTGGAGADVIDARGKSVIKDKNKAAGDVVPAQDYTPASNQAGSVHAKIKLTIKVKNNKGKYDTAIIPAFIGYFNATTHADIHTKAADSVVYFDAPAGSTWKLRDVFRIWGISFDSKHIGRYFASPGKSLTMTIGGVNNTDFANAVLPVSGTAAMEVVIKLG